MASAQAMEEEQQQSVLLSEDAEYDTADSAADNRTKSTGRKHKGEVTNSAQYGVAGVSRDEGSDDDEELSDRDASGEEIDEDASGEENNDLLAQQIIVGDAVGEDDDDEDDENDEDAERDEDDLDEGVGAVKIRPAESDDEDMESDVSDLPSAPDEESDEDEAAWEGGDGAEEDEDEDEDEDAPPEDFEAFLACTGCGENAHQQCARGAAAMSEQNDSKKWKCPDCFAGDSDLDDDDVNIKDDASVDGNARSLSQHSDVAKLSRDSVTPGDRSMSNAGVLEDDTPNGSRALRKRKTSSAEPDEAAGSFRKRRRNLSSDLASQDDGAADQSTGASRASRALRLKAQPPPPVTIEKRSRTSLVLKIEVRPGNLKEILSRRKRDRRRGGGSGGGGGGGSVGGGGAAVVDVTPRPAPPPRSTPRPSAAPTPAVPLPTPFTSDLYSQPFYSFFDKETDDAKGKPYGGILSETEADTSKTLPTPDDRKRFDHAKQKAEDEWRARVLAIQAEAEVPARRHKKANENASQIECIEFGGWEIDTWYAAPYPAEYSRNRVLYICEFCLKYMNSDYVAWRHKLKCATKHPPGDEIYRHGSVSIFEVDGRKHPVYCQNLCLLAKLFLGSKTLYYDVEPFLFYILCEYDDCGYHFVGYFSKEKRASSQNNVSCILTLPIHQRKGYGNLLIDFSYLLTKVEGKTGSPEKPLSDMGLVSYRNYWRLELCRYFLSLAEGGKHQKDGLSVKQISDDTGMTADDVVSALEGLRALVRDPQTQLYAFRMDLDYCRQYMAKWESKGYVRLKPEALAWTPYVMGRSNAVNFELGPPISTIAPREDDEAKVQEGANSVDAESQSLVNSENKEASQQESAAVSDTENTAEPVKSIEKVAPEGGENADPEDQVMLDAHADPDTWAAPYKDIPPTRFEVFPPVTGGRRTDRARQSVSRPAAPRTVSSASRPRPKRSSGSSSSRRPTASRPRSGASRRKTGGTGRGPGRWPKGTKKSDYGNADSGPGLPPGWKEKQARMRAEVEGRNPDAEPLGTNKPAKDEVQVVVAKASSNGKAANGKAANGKTETHGGKGRVEGVDADVDAEGEDE
ncbi:Histone acetyltransferase mst2 [Tolypocladium ophioglossoides CBS 100239]|uniref:Histone acetyltransferase n=1 Tax=Tolypocladium ophioglossoides (strain CBS 100239) TaxID=1163406 RepID=A0A0L0NA37_TOLOC|nr:Histone acetyltransferase mst2 [Tolypocladium ophioglossoides CBS 100239]